MRIIPFSRRLEWLREAWRGKDEFRHRLSWRQRWHRARRAFFSA